MRLNIHDIQEMSQERSVIISESNYPEDQLLPNTSEHIEHIPSHVRITSESVNADVDIEDEDILIVDDNMFNVFTLKTLIKREFGMGIGVSYNGK
jgi:hypothetical protein